MYPNKPEIRIALCAGEASGDLLGAHLIDALRQRYPNCFFYGIGGPRMKAAGLVSLYDQEPLSVRGYFEVLGSLREIAKIRRGLIKDLKDNPPRVFIGIDSPDFNLPVAAKMRSLGVPCIHYVSPSVWAWKSGRVKKIVKTVEKVLCLFPMEPQFYHEAGGDAEFVGHPLAQMLPMDNSKVAVRERLKLDLTAPVFTLMPGSRVSEIDYMAPLFLQAAALMADKLPEAVFLLPYPSAPVREALLKYLNRDEFKNLPVRLQAAKTELACMAADAVLVTSGTAALEVALCKRPMVISYRLSALTYALVKRKVKIKHIGLPNILLGREVVPELIQKDATPEKLAAAMLDWYYHPVRSAELEKTFAKLHRALLRNTDELAAYAVLQAAGVQTAAPTPEYAPPEEDGLPAPALVAAAAEAQVVPPPAETPALAEDTPLVQTAAPVAEAENIAETTPEPVGETATLPENPEADYHEEHSPSLFGRVKKWFGGAENEPEAHTPAREAAVRLAEDVAHSQQPVRHVLEVPEEELSEAVSPIALPPSSVLQSNKSRIFDKYRETPAEAAPEPVAEPQQEEPQAAEPPAPAAHAEPVSAANSESVYVRYINQVSMAWLPEHVSEKARRQAEAEAEREAAEQAAREAAEREAAARAEAERLAAEQAAREAAEQAAREAAEREAAEREAAAAKRRRSVSSYSYGGRDKGKGMFF